MEISELNIVDAWIECDRTLTPEEEVRMRELWALVPPVNCKGLCQDSCTTVPVMPTEAYFLMQRHNAKLIPFPHSKKYIMPTLGPAFEACQFLKDGRCSIYEDRPLICRAFGHNNLTLRCVHDCAPDPSQTPQELAWLFREMVRIINPALPPLLPTASNEDLKDGLFELESQVDEMRVIVKVDEFSPRPAAKFCLVPPRGLTFFQYNPEKHGPLVNLGYPVAEWPDDVRCTLES